MDILHSLHVCILSILPAAYVFSLYSIALGLTFVLALVFVYVFYML